jgi:hypothetical protein
MLGWELLAADPCLQQQQQHLPVQGNGQRTAPDAIHIHKEMASACLPRRGAAAWHISVSDRRATSCMVGDSGAINLARSTKFTTLRKRLRQYREDIREGLMSCQRRQATPVDVSTSKTYIFALLKVGQVCTAANLRIFNNFPSRHHRQDSIASEANTKSVTWPATQAVEKPVEGHLTTPSLSHLGHHFLGLNMAGNRLRHLSAFALRLVDRSVTPPCAWCWRSCRWRSAKQPPLVTVRIGSHLHTALFCSGCVLT